MIHCCPEGRVAAAVVTDNGEPLITEMAHQGHAVVRLGTLGGPCMVWRVGGLRRATETSQVGTDYRVMLSEERGDPVPCHVGARTPVEQQDWGAAAAVPNT
jgi:hypothetical protein